LMTLAKKTVETCVAVPRNGRALLVYVYLIFPFFI